MLIDNIDLLRLAQRGVLAGALALNACTPSPEPPKPLIVRQAETVINRPFNLGGATMIYHRGENSPQDMTIFIAFPPTMLQQLPITDYQPLSRIHALALYGQNKNGRLEFGLTLLENSRDPDFFTRTLLQTPPKDRGYAVLAHVKQSRRLDYKDTVSQIVDINEPHIFSMTWQNWGIRGFNLDGQDLSVLPGGTIRTGN